MLYKLLYKMHVMTIGLFGEAELVCWDPTHCEVQGRGGEALPSLQCGSQALHFIIVFSI